MNASHVNKEQHRIYTEITELFSNKKNDVQLTLYNVRIRHLVLSLLDMIPSVSLGEGYLYCWWLIWMQNDAKKLEND